MFNHQILHGPRVSHFDSPRDCYVGVTKNFLTNIDGWNDGLCGIHTYSYDHALYIHRPDLMDLGLNEVGFLPRRWKTFLEHYVDPIKLSILYYNTIYGKKSEEPGMSIESSFDHRLGSCLLGITVRRAPITVQLYSRACVWAPTGILDISLASLIANKLATDLKSPTPALVIWHVSQINMYVAKSMAWLHSAGVLQDGLDGVYQHSPTGLLVMQELARAQANYSTYNTYASSLRRLARVQGGKEPYAPAYIPESYWHTFVDVRPGTTEAVSLYDWASSVKGMPLDINKVNRIADRVNAHPNDLYSPGDKKVRKFIYEYKNTTRGPAGVGG